MSTRSNIAVERANGAVMDIYCHSDGYLSGVGLTLFQHYKTTKLTLELTRLGDLSYLGDDSTSAHTHAYKRDRGETGVDARSHASLAEYLSNTGEESYRQGWNYEYCYVLTRKQGWLVKQGDDPWESLHLALVTDALLEE